jgi:2-alkyl-3-oxoalkanoate reductase
MKPSILILGASGFIGRAIVRELQASGALAPIAGLHRSSIHGEVLLAQRTVDATSVQSLAAALQGVEAVVNCVAGDSRTIQDGADALIQAASRMPSSPRIVHLSSMSVYGSAEGLLDESAPLLGDLGPYSTAKVAAEKSITGYHRAVILRPGCVYGPGSEQWSTRIARLLAAHRLGDLGSAGDGCCNLVHVSDVVAAVVHALTDPSTDGLAFNLAMTGAPTWNEYLTRYAIALGAVPVRRLSARRLRVETKLLAPPLKVAEIVARAARLPAQLLPPPIPPSLLRLMAQDIRLNSRAAETQLGIRWQDLDTALRETAQWYGQLRSG